MSLVNEAKGKFQKNKILKINHPAVYTSGGPLDHKCFL